MDNGNNLAEAGEVLGYTVTITNTNLAPAEDVVFNSGLDQNVSLKTGSAMTTQGSVTTGNTQGDNVRLWIHIADPTRLITPGDELDLEARRRSTTLYLPTGMISMFPTELATGPMSLIEGQICRWAKRTSAKLLCSTVLVLCFCSP